MTIKIFLLILFPATVFGASFPLDYTRAAGNDDFSTRKEYLWSERYEDYDGNHHKGGISYSDGYALLSTRPYRTIKVGLYGKNKIGGDFDLRVRPGTYDFNQEMMQSCSLIVGGANHQVIAGMGSNGITPYAFGKQKNGNVLSTITSAAGRIEELRLYRRGTRVYIQAAYQDGYEDLGNSAVVGSGNVTYSFVCESFTGLTELDFRIDDFRIEAGDMMLAPQYVDNDGDRLSEDDADCNDSDDTIFPGAAEISNNQIDENCNGMADDVSIATCTDGIRNQNEIDIDCGGPCRKKCT